MAHDRRKVRTSVTLDESIKQRAQNQGINISAAAESGIRRAVEEPMRTHIVNTNRPRLPEEIDGTRVVENGYVASFGPGRFGKKLAPIKTDDIIILYVSEAGAVAVGRCEVPWPGYGVIGLDDDPSERDRAGTTLQREAPGPDEDPLVEVVRRDNRLFPEITRPEFLVRVDWLAKKLPLEHAVTPAEIRSIVGWTPRQTRAEIDHDDDPERLAERILGRRKRIDNR